jgi:hypothetical protein
MTAQISDSVTYQGKGYAIAGKNGTGLFDPAAHGLKPVGRCSACWRGFVCSYLVEDWKLWLDSLEASLDGPAPKLFGVRPKPQKGDFAIFRRGL